jgi:hypothetical protein
VATYTKPEKGRRFHHAATQWIIGSPTTNILEADPNGFIDYAAVDRRTEQQLRSGNVNVWPNAEDALATNGHLLMDHASHVHRMGFNHSDQPLRRVFYQLHIRGFY